MNRLYIEGCKARANKLEYRPLAEQDWQKGYTDMHDILVPIEQEIITATLKYKSVAERKIRELEEQFRGDNSADCSAGTALPTK